jgi:hypothetical protein
MISIIIHVVNISHRQLRFYKKESLEPFDHMHRRLTTWNPDIRAKCLIHSGGSASGASGGGGGGGGGGGAPAPAPSEDVLEPLELWWWWRWRRRRLLWKRTVYR